MTARCGPLLAEIIADVGRRQAILADPRDLHRELFACFAPTTHPEYAGTYQGTPCRWGSPAARPARVCAGRAGPRGQASAPTLGAHSPAPRPPHGFAAFGDRFTLTPEVGAGFSDTARDYGFGWRLTGGPAGAGGDLS